MRKFRNPLIVIVLTALYFTASTMEFNDQAAEHAYYCDMTQSGNWPNYKDVECN